MELPPPDKGFFRFEILMFVLVIVSFLFWVEGDCITIISGYWLFFLTLVVFVDVVKGSVGFAITV